MKRCWFALGLLIALLVAGFWVTSYMEEAHAPIAEAISQAGESSRTGNWDEARELLTLARETWEAKRKAIALFADHDPMEEVDAIFAQLAVAAQWKDSLGFSTLCAYLSEALKAMGEAHGPTWWNIL